MAILLVILTFVALMLVDLALTRRKARTGEASGGPAAEPAEFGSPLYVARFQVQPGTFGRDQHREPLKGRCAQPGLIALGQPLLVAGFQVQPEMCYHLGHAWALAEGPNRVRVGIDDFAARLIGDADRIDLPRVGDQVVQGRPAWVLHHGNREAPMLSPVTGRVVELNPLVSDGRIAPSSAPYTHGWLMSVRMSDGRADFNNLLRDDLLPKWFEILSARLRSRLKQGVALSFHSGRMAPNGVCDMIDEVQWNDIVQEFLLAEPRNRCWR